MKNNYLYLIPIGLLATFAFVIVNKNTNEPIPSEKEMEKIEEAEPINTKYLRYTEQNLEKAQKGKTLLFFHANWCPTCKVAEEDILKNLDKIPDDLTILKIDYDNSKDLKSKYGVTYQHTFVQIDKDGNEITKWIGGEFNSIIENTQ